ncbi:YkvA family protein [Pontibacter locisalis]|uniref:YkvA family protein n=1 Tax=Pontibacter locisalis TaxID=1719035 RepID=A0ABW5IIS5_9BACT
MMQLNTLKQKTNAINTEIYSLYLSYRDERVRWYVRILVAFFIGYAVSPIDFIPDLVPVFGFLDDVLVVALGFHFSYQLMAKNIVEQARLQALEGVNKSSQSGALGANRIVNYVWLLVFTLVALLVYKFLNPSFV